MEMDSCGVLFRVCGENAEKHSTSFTLQLSKTIKVCDLKQLVSEKLKCEDVNLVLCGEIMDNLKCLADYKVASSTAITVLLTNIRTISAPTFLPSYPQAYLTGIWLHRWRIGPNISRPNVIKHPQTSGFYVYCKDKCHNIVKGRLKVVCASCSSSAIVLNNEPNKWSDIMLRSTVECTCYSNLCGQETQFAKFYFKCFNEGCKDFASPIKCNKYNIEEKECCICMEIEKNIIEFPCQCNHVTCIDCFTGYAREELFSRHLSFNTLTGYSISCPCGCENSTLNDPHVFYYLGESEYNLYQEIAAETCVLQGMNGFICPNSTCGEGLFKTSNISEKSCKCSKCGYEFCADCKEIYHGNTKCTFNNLHNSNVASDYINSVKTIKKISKTCPGCKIPTERSGGCMHLTCFKCKFEWCWLCQEAWGLNCQERHWFG